MNYCKKYMIQNSLLIFFHKNILSMSKQCLFFAQNCSLLCCDSTGMCPSQNTTCRYYYQTKFNQISEEDIIMIAIGVVFLFCLLPVVFLIFRWISLLRDRRKVPQNQQVEPIQKNIDNINKKEIEQQIKFNLKTRISLNHQTSHAGTPQINEFHESQQTQSHTPNIKLQEQRRIMYC